MLRSYPWGQVYKPACNIAWYAIAWNWLLVWIMIPSKFHKTYTYTENYINSAWDCIPIDVISFLIQLEAAKCTVRQLSIVESPDMFSLQDHNVTPSLETHRNLYTIRKIVVSIHTMLHNGTDKWPIHSADEQGSGDTNRVSSAKCKSVRKPSPNLSDTPGALANASKYFQILPTPPGAFQSALRLCKSIVIHCWKHLQLWRWI